MQDEFFRKPVDLEQKTEHEIIIRKQEIVRAEGPQIDHFGKILFERLKQLIGKKTIKIDKNNIIDQVVTMRIDNVPYEQIVDNIVSMYNIYFGS